MKDDYTDVQQSYGRCLNHGGFIDRFYEILMDSHPDIPAMFARTDMGRQRRALRRGITTAILYAGGNQLVTSTVETMAQVHSRHGRAPVKPAYYRFWMDSLVVAVREHDPRCTDTLASRWREALRPVIDTFIERY